MSKGQRRGRPPLALVLEKACSLLAFIDEIESTGFGNRRGGVLMKDELVARAAASLERLAEIAKHTREAEFAEAIRSWSRRRESGWGSTVESPGSFTRKHAGAIKRAVRASRSLSVLVE